jgi:hypothetical protein
MKKNRLFAAAVSAIAISCVVGISGCAEAPPAPTGQVMTGEEIKSLFNGKSEEATTYEGGIYRAYHPDPENERGEYTAPDGKVTKVSARLTYKSDAICAVFEPKDWGSQCYQFTKDGEKITYKNLKRKNDYGVVKVMDGNPFGF